MADEYRVFGPPGTGKTTYLSRQIERACQAYPPTSIFACSFTKAAAKEIAGRGTSIPEQNVGTIHGLCYRSMGTQIRIAEADKELVSEWNDRFGDEFPIDAERRSDFVSLDPWGGNTPLGIYNLERSRLVTESEVPDFVRQWERFKAEYGALDYTDLLVKAPAELEECRVLFVDEAQDLTPLQWQVVRRWGSSYFTRTFVVAGDDDQSIYSFTGAEVSYFLTEIPEDHIRVLDQSYRMPSEIHRFSENLIRGMRLNRQDKSYEPYIKGGSVKMVGTSLGDGERLADEAMKAAEDGTVMILASCKYMLKDIINELRRSGYPFWNPYRLDWSEWNPLGRGKMVSRIRAFLNVHKAFKEGREFELTSPEIWQNAISPLRSKDNLVRGGKKELSDLPHNVNFMYDILDVVLTQDAMIKFRDGDLEWFFENMTKAVRGPMEYPRKVIEKHGIEALTDTPRIIVGTIHSVKGGEAETVFLSPDVSRNTMLEMDQGDKAHDDVLRCMYVGATRASKQLVILQPYSRYYFDDWPSQSQC